MMTLDKLEKQINPKIWQRGHNYFAQGLVDELWRPDPNFYRAVVSGSVPYDVAIRLLDTGELESAVCDCPYDWGTHCKHQVAVLLTIGEHLQSGKPWQVAQTGTKRGLRRLLEALSKDELVDFVLEFAKYYGLREEIHNYIDDNE